MQRTHRGALALTIALAMACAGQNQENINGKGDGAGGSFIADSTARLEPGGQVEVTVGQDAIAMVRLPKQSAYSIEVYSLDGSAFQLDAKVHTQKSLLSGQKGIRTMLAGGDAQSNSDFIYTGSYSNSDDNMNQNDIGDRILVVTAHALEFDDDNLYFQPTDGPVTLTLQFACEDTCGDADTQYDQLNTWVEQNTEKPFSAWHEGTAEMIEFGADWNNHPWTTLQSIPYDLYYQKALADADYDSNASASENPGHDNYLTPDSIQWATSYALILDEAGQTMGYATWIDLDWTTEGTVSPLSVYALFDASGDEIYRYIITP